eukprot:2920094-Rhodomonas_salina.10
MVRGFPSKWAGVSWMQSSQAIAAKGTPSLGPGLGGTPSWLRHADDAASVSMHLHVGLGCTERSGRTPNSTRVTRVPNFCSYLLPVLGTLETVICLRNGLA